MDAGSDEPEVAFSHGRENANAPERGHAQPVNPTPQPLHDNRREQLKCRRCGKSRVRRAGADAHARRRHPAARQRVSRGDRARTGLLRRDRDRVRGRPERSPRTEHRAFRQPGKARSIRLQLAGRRAVVRVWLRFSRSEHVDRHSPAGDAARELSRPRADLRDELRADAVFVFGGVAVSRLGPVADLAGLALPGDGGGNLSGRTRRRLRGGNVRLARLAGDAARAAQFWKADRQRRIVAARRGGGRARNRRCAAGDRPSGARRRTSPRRASGCRAAEGLETS